MRKITPMFISKVLMTLDVLFAALPFLFCWYFAYMPQTALASLPYRHWMMVVLFVAAYVCMANAFEAFQYNSYSLIQLVVHHAFAVILADAILFVILCFITLVVPNMIPALECLGVQLVLGVLISVLAILFSRNKVKKIRSVLVYKTEAMSEDILQDKNDLNRFEIAAAYPYADVLNNIDLLDGFNCVFLRGIYPHERDIIMKYCIMHNVSCMIVPRVGDTLINCAHVFHLFHLPILRVTRYRPSLMFVVCKRLFDILVSGIALILLSPVIIPVAIAIRREDGGPAFYKQIRLTQDGREFEILKFRSMRVDAEKNGVAVFSQGENDPRITKVGRFIRKVRLDELPQLINILKGDMSIVGPRPERPSIAAEYEKTIPEFALRLQAPAGLTGYAQVYGKYNTDLYDKLCLDLMYISNPSLLNDLKIMVETVRILFSAESIEGVAADKATVSKK